MTCDGHGYFQSTENIEASWGETLPGRFLFGGGPIAAEWSNILPLPLEEFVPEGALVLQNDYTSNGIVIPGHLTRKGPGEGGKLRPQIVLLPRTSFNDIYTTEVQCHKVKWHGELPTAVIDAIDELQSILGPICAVESGCLMQEERRVLCSFPTVRGIRFGWVPSESRSYEELCCFLGASFPFIVRRVD